ncbi:4-(cytidine 5'-diphospho)-2-C-methyl-D-erythritol kinase [Lacticaseibacillus thailandensis]|uniref:4-diphosphocytidyl-2-C-methyl-D-erythritol kinase n=1 Tax=Lacticaseibacillus thailandensis DSM 22698 = JCM 13996 TaxID=1423810 RepID=A0A0R2C757_9LACO|nr:4-(cytidine 5'-diphospho)-2-C-methyl-D-erythritol kinase [Lacticaseibacillus thailandensis]KRM87367.1 4-diphosphocytidyl-2-C-methyl-D-erythritol kinase [Lacticaseibacillus thailandensis DSM 22698 = JCM 13996]
MEITQKAPAKINLSLDALYRHGDGEHEWRMVMTSIDLADYVSIRPGARKIRVSTDSGFVPEDARNLAFQAARILRQEAGINAGASIYIEKHIPVAAGLGGGSADAAAVLRGLNELWGLHYSQEQLARIGLKVDSDVPFCVYSQPALVTGRGEQVTPLGTLPSFWVVLVKPAISVTTARILSMVDYDQVLHRPQTDRVLKGITQRNFDLMVSGMGNALEDVTATRFPVIKELEQRLVKYGASVAQMSGTGPTVFGLCPTRSRAERVYNSMRGFCKEVYLVRPLRLG